MVNRQPLTIADLDVIGSCVVCSRDVASLRRRPGSLELHSYFIWGRVGYATNGVGVVE
jgi:hypothetical protein